MVMFVQVYYPLSTVLTFEQEILLHVAYFEIHYKQEGTVTVFFYNKHIMYIITNVRPTLLYYSQSSSF